MMKRLMSVIAKLLTAGTPKALFVGYEAAEKIRRFNYGTVVWNDV